MGTKDIITVNTKMYDFAVNNMKRSSTRIQRRAYFYIRKLVHHTEKWMKYYTAPRTRRATGKLNKNIASYIKRGFLSTQGRIYVKENKDTRHAWATEKGFSKTFKIHATGTYMRFPLSSWRRGSSSASIIKYASDGWFTFKSVKRGKYKGKYFRDKSYKKLLAYYAKTKGMAESNIVRQIEKS